MKTTIQSLLSKKKSCANALVLTLVLLMSIPSCFGQVVNAYAKVTAISGKILTLSNVNEAFHTFNIGEKVIIMQMQDNVLSGTNNDTNFGTLGSIANAGQYEVGLITAKTSTTITLSNTPNNTFNIGTNSSVQVISFRSYGSPDYTTTADMVALDWDGNVGGVLAIYVSGTFTLNNNITANGAGFRGGASSANDGTVDCNAVYRTSNSSLSGEKGEGIFMRTDVNQRYGRAKIINGGGGGNRHNAGGAGGGNVSTGGNGGPGYNCSGSPVGGQGGLSLNSYININRIFMGGGGGGGQQNNSVGTAGTDGGGVILIKASQIITSGSCSGRVISANGLNAANPTDDGAGGAGAGGTIVIDVGNFNVLGTCPVSISANGGNGGTSNDPSTHGGGGGGSQGKVFYSNSSPVNVTTTTNNGNSGCNNSSSPCTNQAAAPSGTNGSGITTNSGSSALTSASPGGVNNNLVWWLKANAGVLNASSSSASDGEAISQWNDQSTAANNATQMTPANRPIFKTNIINSNPALRFSTDQFIDAISTVGISPAQSFNFLTVFKQNSFTAGTVGDANGTYIIDHTSNTTNLLALKMVNTNKFALQKRNDDGSGIGGPISATSASTALFNLVDYYRNYGTGYGIFLNGRSDVTTGDDSGGLTGTTLRLGRHASTSNSGLNGDFAEIIVYNTYLTNSDRLKAESYLAIKYGITLDQTTPTDYVSSKSTVVFPASTSHASYNNDIAGIAKDDLSALNQASSQSQNAQSLMRIFNPSSLDNGDFLLWGHNSPSISNSTNTPPGYLNRLSRVWRAAETGETGTVSVSFDLSGLSVDLSDVNKFALLIDGDGNFSDASIITSGRTIVGSVVTFTSVDINSNNYFTLATDIVPGPGGVAGPVVWLRADKNVYTDAGSSLATVNNQPIQQWNNQGQTSYNVAQTVAARKPTYQTGVFNGNPVVRFNAASSTSLDFASMGISSSSDLNFLIVFQPSTINGGALSDNVGGFIIDRTQASASTNPLSSLKLLSTSAVGFQKRDDNGNGLGGIATTTSVSTTSPQVVDYYRDYGVRYGIYFNGGVLEATQTPDSDGGLTIPNLRIGASYNQNNAFSGDIAEFIFYNKDLTTIERNKIDSYLAIKYGITISQSNLTDYFSSSGVVVYPTTSTHSSFKSDIAGIGRDDASKLNQLSSKSVNVNSVLRIQNPSSLGDLEFLIWGDNAATLLTPNTVDVDGILIKARLSRAWKIAETSGDVGTVDLTFDLTNVPGGKMQSDLRLLIDRDQDGFNDNDVTPVSGTLTGQLFTISGINLQNGDLLSIGSTNVTTTPLPIELVAFDLNYDKGKVVVTWTTNTEINNDFFTLERSADGTQFKTIATIKGAGTITQTKYYQFDDLTPLIGRSYYRLKQTDFDKKEESLGVKAVSINEIPEQQLIINIAPNPARSGRFTVTLSQSTDDIIVSLLNLRGQTLSEYYPKVSSPDFTIELPLDIVPGMYFVKILVNGKNYTYKLMIE